MHDSSHSISYNIPEIADEPNIGPIDLNHPYVSSSSQLSKFGHTGSESAFIGIDATTPDYGFSYIVDLEAALFANNFNFLSKI